MFRPVGSNYRLGGGGTHKKQLQIGGAHIIFFKMTDHFFLNLQIIGGGGARPPVPPPIPTGLMLFVDLFSPTDKTRE